MTVTQTNQLSAFATYLKKDEGMADNTVKGYRADMIMFFDWLTTDISELTRDVITKYKSHLESLKHSPKTFNHKLSTLKKYNEYLVSTNQQSTMVFIKRDFIKLQDQNVSPTKVSFIEVDTVLSSIKKNESIRDYAISCLMANTGLRISEAINLEFNNLKLDIQELHFIGKGNKYREVSIPPIAIQALKEYLSHRNEFSKYAAESPYIFVSQRSPKLTSQTIEAIFKKNNKKKSTNKITPHGFRHNYVTYLVKKTDMTIKEIQEAVGHSSITTTQRYMQTDIKEIKEKTQGICIGG
jgi:integrase/recombinase XerD